MASINWQKIYQHSSRNNRIALGLFILAKMLNFLTVVLAFAGLVKLSLVLLGVVGSLLITVIILCLKEFKRQNLYAKGKWLKVKNKRTRYFLQRNHHG